MKRSARFYLDYTGQTLGILTFSCERPPLHHKPKCIKERKDLKRGNSNDEIRQAGEGKNREERGGEKERNK